jgi:2-oxo-4-hydroxy-4-carboxy-5-ureidoimidazoline decarboxylase
MESQKLTIEKLNSFAQDTFVHALAGLFEGPPWLVASAWAARPFASRDQLYQTLCSLLSQAPVEQQVALLYAHPDLVGQAALAGTLSPASNQEQAAAGLNQLSPAEIATFQRLNRLYRDRFGFPFVICARENKQESILAGFAERLPHTYEQEIALALAEVAKICALRLRDSIDE